MQKLIRKALVALVVALSAAVALDARLTQVTALIADPNTPGFVAELFFPPNTDRAPVVLVAAADLQALRLAVRLSSLGIAAMKHAAPREQTAAIPAAALAQWIAALRNDERFPTVVVLADGDTIEASIIAARAARADGIIRRTGAPRSQELERVIAQVGEFAGTSLEADADQIAKFARSVPALGRRGTRPARPETKRASPRQVVLTTIDGVRVGIEWGAPQKRGREIWGALVPWNNVWMPGADESTTLTTNGPITIGTLAIPAGDHTFYTFPSADRFELIVSKDVGQFHTVRAPELELGRVTMIESKRADAVEGLTFAIEGSAPDVRLKISWDIREFSAPIKGR